VSETENNTISRLDKMATHIGCHHYSTVLQYHDSVMYKLQVVDRVWSDIQ